MIDLEVLKENIREYATEFIGGDFEFREYQFESIYNICANILGEEKKNTQIIEAPTGSGKSLLNIISAGVLAKYYGMESYILVSDLFLWKQYDEFVKKHPQIKKTFGILKGQTGNYNCAKNNQDMRNADCRMAGISWAKMFNHKSAAQLGYECASKCPYVQARKKAVSSPVVIMTYQLYHYMINVVEKIQNQIGGSNTSFKSREIIFCDECHNIPGIVRNNFTPEMRFSDISNLKTLYKWKQNVELSLFDEEEHAEEIKVINDIYKWEDIEKRYEKIFDVVLDEHSPIPEDISAINDYLNLLGAYGSTVTDIEEHLSMKGQVLHKKFSSDDVKFYKACSWYRNTLCFWNDFATCVEATGSEYILKSIDLDRKTNENVVHMMNCKEDYLCYFFLLDTAPFQVLMSATTGGEDAFTENIGTSYMKGEYDFTIIPSTFNFDKSPVNFLNRYKMSYANKATSFPPLRNIIYKICEQKKDERGMIQTGSYANALEIYKNAPQNIKQRLLLYNNSREKEACISIHQMSNNTILIGPTLVDGIDLPGDKCKFIIILKVPYPVIVDDYVKMKMKLFPLWYNSSTSNSIIQGIGRGNRFKDDECITYILDACFLQLYNSTKDQYPVELQNRIHIYK